MAALFRRKQAAKVKADAEPAPPPTSPPSGDEGPKVATPVQQLIGLLGVNLCQLQNRSLIRGIGASRRGGQLMAEVDVAALLECLAGLLPSLQAACSPRKAGKQ